MFLVLAIISTIGYTIQGTLMVKFFRRNDPLLVTATRGITLGITMLPLWYWVDDYAFLFIPSFFPIILSAGILGAIGVGCAGTSVRHLPVGVAIAIQQGSLVSTVILLELAFLQTKPSITEYAFIVGITIGSCYLSYSENQNSNQDAERNPVLGSALCVGFGFFLAAAYILLSKLSRSTEPFATAHIWEFSIGVFAYLMFWLRKWRTSLPSSSTIWLPQKEVFKIMLCASPTALGTGLYALAVTMGPASIVNAINTTQIAGCMILSVFIFKERLKTGQVIGIFIGFILVCVLAIIG